MHWLLYYICEKYYACGEYYLGDKYYVLTPIDDQLVCF